MSALTKSEYQALLRSDFYAFIQRVFYEINPQTKFKGNWHIELLVAKLEACRVCAHDACLNARRRMTWPTSLSLSDRNGTRRECVAEAFNTTYNILVLLYPKAALTKTTIILPKTISARF